MSTTIAPSFDSILIKPDTSVLRFECGHKGMKVHARFTIDPLPSSPRDRDYWMKVKTLFCKDFVLGMSMYRDMKSRGITTTKDATIK
jgi:hypothetical protein